MEENTVLPEVIDRHVGRRGTSLYIMGLTLMGAGYLFGMSPMVWAVLETPAGQNPFSDASAGGASMWAMILTLPSGAVTVLIGLVVFAAGLVVNLTVKLPAKADFPRTRAIGFARRSRILAFGFSPALYLATPMVIFVMYNMMHGPLSGLGFRILFECLEVLSVGGALYYAIRSGKKITLFVTIAVSLLWIYTIIQGPQFSPTHLFNL